jgi:putative membrane protein
VTAVRLALTELRRITAGRLPKLAVFALVLVPLLYGSLYLYANWDPYGKLDRVPAALVVQDTGATGPDGKRLTAGDDVATELLSAKKFDWHRVDAAEAEAGIRDGRYTFGVTLPADFSQALLSPANFTPRPGTITLTTNDANNYLGSTIANQVLSELRRAVSSKVSAQAADRLLMGFGTIRGETVKAADGAGQLADGAGQARDGLGTLVNGQRSLLDGSQRLADGLGTAADQTGAAVTGADQLRDGSAQVADGLHTLRQRTAALPDQTRKLADGSRQVADGNAKVAQTGTAVADAAQQLASGLDQVDGDVAARLAALGFTPDEVSRVMSALAQARQPLDNANQTVQRTAGQLRALADGSAQVADGNAQLAAQTPQLADAIAQLDDGARRVADGNAQLAGKLPQLRDGLGQLHDGAVQLRDGERSAVDGSAKLHDGSAQLASGATQLHDGLADGADRIPNPDDPTREATAQTIGDPVATRTLGQTTAGSYGSGLAPFFLGLATWIGGFVLFLLLRPLSSRALAAGQAPFRIALGGWLPAAALGFAQVVVLYSVVTLAVGISPARPLATFGFLVLTSFAFTAILHALNALLGAVGKFLGLVLLILQLVSAGGTFPWQTIPGPLHPLHQVLPMGYVVDGLRHLLYGGTLDAVGRDVAVLVGYLVLGLATATFAAYKHRVWTPSRLKPELVL